MLLTPEGQAIVAHDVSLSCCCCRCVCVFQVIDSVKQTHPQLPIILYISGSGGLLERMAAANPDIISIDQSVDIVDGIKRVGSGFAIQVGESDFCRPPLFPCRLSTQCDCCYLWSH